MHICRKRSKNILVCGCFVLGNMYAVEDEAAKPDAGSEMTVDAPQLAEEQPNISTTPELSAPEPIPVSTQTVVPIEQKKEAPAPEPIPVPQMPTPPAEQKGDVPATDTEPVEPAEITGIDTISLENKRGNWLFKNIWWNRSEAKYEKIRAAVEQVSELRMQFFASRTALDKTVFEPFFADIGFSQGELQGILEMLVERLNQEREKEGVLTDQERDLLETLTADRELLEQLHRDTQSILLLEHSAEDVIERVMEQRARISNYENDAWNARKEIARILSDTQARELYYRVDSDWRNIKNIYRYLEQDLKRYFDQLIANSKQQIERIKNNLQTLKEKGFDLRQTVLLATNQAEKASEEEPESTPKPHKPRPSGIVGITAAFFMRIVSLFWYIITWVPYKIASLVRTLFYR